MAVDVKEVNRYLFPAGDTECSRAVFKELWKLHELPVRNKILAVQAGGNVGVFPVAMSHLFGQVFTFEPDPDNFHCLKLNLKTHDCKNVKAYNAGLSDHPGTCGMFEPENEPNNCGALQVQEDTGNILLTTIDTFDLPFCDLIYLDVEGFEDKALLGAKETIAKYKPVIVTENKGLNDRFPATPPDPSTAFREWMFAQFGYQLHSRLMRDDVFVCSR